MTTTYKTPVKAGVTWNRADQPTPKQLQTLVTWANHGPGALDAIGCPGSRAQKNRTRVLHLMNLRALILAAGLPQRFEDMRREVLRGGPVEGLDPRLLDELCRVFRLLGFLTAGAREVVPLTSMQVFVLGKLVWGVSMKDVSAELGLRMTASRETVARMRRDHGCATTFQLIACAYRHGWLPDQDEFRALHRAMVWPRGRPPYQFYEKEA